MDNKNSFYTLSYKNHYIQGCYNDSKKTEEIKFNNNSYKFIIAAKSGITKFIKNTL